MWSEEQAMCVTGHRSAEQMRRDYDSLQNRITRETTSRIWNGARTLREPGLSAHATWRNISKERFEIARRDRGHESLDILRLQSRKHWVSFAWRCVHGAEGAEGGVDEDSTVAGGGSGSSETTGEQDRTQGETAEGCLRRSTHRRCVFLGSRYR